MNGEAGASSYQNGRKLVLHVMVGVIPIDFKFLLGTLQGQSHIYILLQLFTLKTKDEWLFTVGLLFSFECSLYENDTILFTTQQK